MAENIKFAAFSTQNGGHAFDLHILLSTSVAVKVKFLLRLLIEISKIHAVSIFYITLVWPPRLHFDLFKHKNE